MRITRTLHCFGQPRSRWAERRRRLALAWRSIRYGDPYPRFVMWRHGNHLSLNPPRTEPIEEALGDWWRRFDGQLK